MGDRGVDCDYQIDRRDRRGVVVETMQLVAKHDDVGALP